MAVNLTKRFPAEWEEHNRTFMTWPSIIAKIQPLLLPHFENVREDSTAIATAISKFEEVVILANPSDFENVNELFKNNPNIDVKSVPLDDLWARDTLPIFIENGVEQVGINLNFNAWGNRYDLSNDKLLAPKFAEMFGIKYVHAPFVSEGGALETDGLGTLLVTESSIFNPNRNSGKSRDDIEIELKEILGIQKVIWFKGVLDKDTTDAHVDAIARFASPGVVVLSRPAVANGKYSEFMKNCSDDAFEVLKNSIDAQGNSFTIVELPEPDLEKSTLTGGESVVTYVNYLVVNGGVIMPRFNDKEADDRAKDILQKLFPTREVVQIEINNLGKGGGGIHCSTFHQPMSVRIGPESIPVIRQK